MSLSRGTSIKDWSNIPQDITGYLYFEEIIDNLDFLEDKKINSVCIIVEGDGSPPITNKLYNKIKPFLEKDTDGDMCLSIEAQSKMIKEGVIGIK